MGAGVKKEKERAKREDGETEGGRGDRKAVPLRG